MNDRAVVDQQQLRQRLVVTDPIPVLDSARFEQMYRIAKVMALSSLIPDSLGKDKDGNLLPIEVVISNCFLIVNQAVGWHMDPFAVAQCASVVKGRVCYEGKLIAAVLDRCAGVVLSYAWNDAQGDALEITVSGTIPGEAVARTVKGTVGAWKTTRTGSPWAVQPRMQLAYRGAREWGRLHRPAVMLGVYSDDELEAAVERQERRPPPPPAFVAIEGAGETRKPVAPAIEHKQTTAVETAVETRDPVVTSGTQTQTQPPAAQRRPPAPPSARPMPTSPSFDFAAHKARAAEALTKADSFDACDEVFARFGQNWKANLSDEQYMEIRDLVTDRQDQFEPVRRVEWTEDGVIESQG